MREFLQALWPRPIDGNLTLWSNPSKSSIHLPLAAFDDEVVVEQERLNAAGEDVYFSLGLRADGLPPGKRGGKQDVVAIPGFAVDFDFAHPTAHKALNLPTEADLDELLADTPDPSIVVRSGHGMHCYWVFERSWELPNPSARTQAQVAYKAFWERFEKRFSKRDWKLDNTASIERVWRIPGMINHKSGAAVELIHLSADRYTIDRLAPKGAGTRAAPKAARIATAVEHVAPIENTTAPQDVLAALGRLSATNPNKRAIALMLAGESFAERGERDATLHRVCSVIAFLPESEPYDPETLAEVLRPALTAWAAEPDATKDVEEELAKAIEKLERAQHAKAAQVEAEQHKLGGLANFVKVATADGPAEVGPDGMPVDPGTAATAKSPAFIAQHAIIQVRSSFWIYSFVEQQYVGPKIKDEILTYCRDAWPIGVAPNRFDLEYTNSKDAVSKKTVAMVMEEYGTVAKGVIGKLALDQSYYDARTSQFIEAICPLRVTEPVFDAQIDRWLGLLVGEAHKDKLLDWIAAVPQLDEQCCALYLDGVTGAGKGLLAAGLARLWTEGSPTKLTNVLGNYNSDMFQCPFILLDEGLPKTQGNVSANIRTLLGSSAHTLTEKYVVNRQVIGAVRLFIAANNPDVLAFGEENGTANDAEAYVNRFLHIEARREAADWLREHNADKKLSDSWVLGDLIAKHCLWLAFNREIVRGRRFLVEGETAGDMHRKLLMQGGVSGLICEWLARFASTPTVLTNTGDKRKNGLVIIGNSELLVNTQGLIDGWPIYMKRDGREIPLPSTTKVGTTLSKLSAGRSKKIGPRNGTRTNYHIIDFDVVTSWSDANQIGNSDDMRKNWEMAKPLVGVEAEDNAGDGEEGRV